MSNEMLLPSGKFCGMCYAYRHCKMLFGCKETNNECDWFPVRFKERATEIVEAKPEQPTTPAGVPETHGDSYVEVVDE